MKVKWQHLEMDGSEIQCPICNHQTIPPKYPYCEHVLFVYLDAASDDSFFIT